MRPEVALEALLGALFSEAELRRHLTTGPDGDEVADRLPGPPISPADLREVAVTALCRRGLVNRAFFDRLERVRPQRVAEIREVRASFLPEVDLDDAMRHPGRRHAEILIVFAGEDADLRHGLQPHLASHIDAGYLTVVDVMITAEHTWEAMLRRNADRCTACLLIDSPALRASTFVDSPAYHQLAARRHSGQLCPIVVRGRPVPADPDSPDLFRSSGIPLGGRPPLQEMGTEERRYAGIDVATALVDIARAHALASRLVALYARNCEVLDWWRQNSPLGRPDPADSTGPFVDLVWAVALDLSQRTAHERQAIGAARPLDSPSSEPPGRGPLVRLVLDPVPGRDALWTLRAWYIDSSGTHAISPSDPEITSDTLGEVLQRIFHHGAPAPQSVARLELICDVLGRDWPADEWRITDEFGEVSFPAPITLRERMRYQRPQLRKLLAQRTEAHWNNPARPLVGPGGARCPAPTQCLDAAVVKDEATRRLQQSAAVCAGLLQLPPTGPQRFARLAEILRWGLPIAIWSRTNDSAVDDLLREFLSTVEIGRLPEAVYERRRATMPEAPPGGHLSLLYEDPAFPLPDDILTSPT